MNQEAEFITSLTAAPERIRARTERCLTELKGREEVDSDRVAAIGCCFGEAMALELARSGADLKAAVGFHCGLARAAPENATSIKAKILVRIGAEDPSVPVDARTGFEEKMRKAQADWQVHLYGGVVHSFTSPEADQLGCWKGFDTIRRRTRVLGRQ